MRANKFDPKFTLRGPALSRGSNVHDIIQMSPDLSPEPVYDPFSGHLAFILPPQAPTDPAHDETTKHELWTQLGRIRELQSEIAIMHTRMEGIGLGEHRHPKKGPVRTHTDTIVVGEEWADAAEEEHDKRKARDAEFENLAQAFEGRHAAIDEIMDKLGDLSKTLTAFHALPTPTMDFARKNTKDSMATMFSSPSPTFTTVPTSPFSPTASPTSAHQTAPNIIQAELDKLEIPRAESPASVASASVDGSS
ncbi:hypothetical protein EW026_g4331 [Hermanssonia centrifuga]|uniref:Uncharacterized protein n=1 Tax=Hermanssonia centrifuga TaxID=98765 RepID=A0A4S4KHH8_9APHY|nr:hypothetical protein EW026_g4331 [Hermanssonia centrifuga]